MLLLAFCACLWAASDPKAVAEANAALALAREGKYELAIPHYRTAIALDSRLPGVYLNLGLAYFKLNRLPDAASAFEQAIKADPASFQARVLLGMSYYGCRRFDAAAPHLKLAAEQQPDNTELRYKLAQSYLWSKQYQAAIHEFRLLLTK
ncbi:MAG: tetratricopeptide repeat protein, partial [Bryobacteraceae bacterium]